MPNPEIDRDTPAPQPEYVPSNGILARLPAPVIGAGMQQLPAAGPEQLQTVREVTVDADAIEPEFRLGLVRITYEIYSYKHGRSRHWSWRARRADKA